MIRNGFKTTIFLCILCVVQFGVLAEIPAGYYYNAHNTKKAALKTALHQLSAPQQVLKYGSGSGYTWEGFFQTDQNQDGSVIDMYSPIVRYFDGFKGVSDMHIEHSFPKSWWGGHEWNVYKDLFHLYPSDGSTNMSKSNNPLGIVTGVPTTDNGVSKIGSASYPGYTGNVFEPADEYKGDFARSYFYVVTTYQDLAPYWNSPMLDKNTYPVWKPWAIELLKQWHQQDPVSIKEVLRQEAVFGIQGNRNPFIDYPDLVNYIWGSDTIQVYPFPVETEPFIVTPRSGEKMNFDVILQGDSLKKLLFVQGANISSNVSLSLKKNNPNFLLQIHTLMQNTLQDGVNVELVFCPTASGSFNDTLLISGGGLAQPRIIQLTGKASKDFMVLDAEEHTPIGARLNWITDPHADDYQLTVYEGATKAGNLLFSSYVEGTGFNKAVELYNGTGRTLDLSDYTLQKQSNGEGEFNAIFRMNGLLPNNQTYLVAYNIVSNVLRNQAQAVNDSVMSFNGNDAIGLYHNGILTDIVGYADGGIALFWGENKTLKRKPYVTHPSPSYDENQWVSYPIDYFDLLGSHQIQFQSQETPVLSSVSTQGNSFYNISGLNPATTYTYFVETVTAGEFNKSINTLQFTTTALSVPEVNAAVDVQPLRFTANWEADLYTDNFLLNVFQLIGSADTTVVEGFNDVGTSGKPLPEGWSGTASGNYTTTPSSGIAIPSVALRNTGEFIQTKVYPHPVTQFSFMYRFPSGAGASSLKVEALSGENWTQLDMINYFNTSKYTMNYSFDRADDIRAFRVTYNFKATTANLAVDDFTVTYGNQVSEYLIQNELLNGNMKVVENLTPSTDYYYNVRAVLGTSTSPLSETVKVTTLVETGLPTNLIDIKLYSTSDGVLLSGLTGGEEIRIYTLSGTLFYSQKATVNSVKIALKPSNIYILSIQHNDYTHHTKIIR